jgi:hypothetical protein
MAPGHVRASLRDELSEQHADALDFVRVTQPTPWERFARALLRFRTQARERESCWKVEIRHVFVEAC